MSKLDNILIEHFDAAYETKPDGTRVLSNFADPNTRTGKQQVIALFLELIGESEALPKHGLTYGDTTLQSYDVHYGRNDIREELRQKVAEL